MLRLYDSRLSGNAWKVRILLTQLGLSFERVTLDLAKAAAFERGVADHMASRIADFQEAAFPALGSSHLEGPAADIASDSRVKKVYLGEGFDETSVTAR